MIKHQAFKHGWFYHYRVHERKLETISDSFPALNQFLYSLFHTCPDEFFRTGPRGSKLRLDIPLDITSIPGHEVCSYAKHGLANGRFSTAHSNVCVTMLEQDSMTVAVEVPLWLEEHELPLFQELFDSTLPLTGHIDCLSVREECVWIWDFKPRAEKEKYAHVQTSVYAFMLSVRTGIPLSKIRCGYFDENDCFVFTPPSLIEVPIVE